MSNPVGELAAERFPAAVEGGFPIGTIPCLMIQLTVCPKSEDIEPISTPGDHGWTTIERPAKRFPAARGSPARPIPELMVHLIIRPKSEDIKPIRIPRGHR